MTVKDANDFIELHRVSTDERPKFHVTAPVGWLNDPNGFSLYKGRIHLFYQYNPYDSRWGPMHWGHVSTTDLIKWEELPVAIAPDQVYDNRGCFSGSAIEKDGKHYLIYTGVSADPDLGEVQGQCLAVGDGTRYEKNSDNFIISYQDLPADFSRKHFRDPKVWQEEDGYYLVVGNLNQDSKPHVLLFKSLNLYHWDYCGVLAEGYDGRWGRMWECPDFFALDDKYILICSPQNMSARGLEFHNGHNSIYFVGHYDKQNSCFIKGEAKSLDYGLDFYAPQTMLLPDGRRVLIGWLKSWDSVSPLEELSWQGMMTIPRELSWKGAQLIQQPIQELKNYYANPYRQQVSISGAWQDDNLSGRVIDLTLTISGQNYQEICIDLACDADLKTSFIYYPLKGIIEMDRTYSGLVLDQNCQRKMQVAKGEHCQLRFIMDSHSIELFVNDGEQVASMEIDTPMTANQIRFYCQGQCQLDIEKYDLQFN